MYSVHLSLRSLVRSCSAALLGVLGLVATRAGVTCGQESGAPPAGAAADLVYWPPEDYRELLVMDEPMKRFFADRVARRGSDSERLRKIVDAIVRPAGLNFAYELEGTYDAREAFRRRRGNCVAFAFLVVAAAREYGLDVRFQEIDPIQDWSRFDRFIASVRHTNVRMSTDGEVYVVDPWPDLTPKQVFDTRYVVSDTRAFAHFYSTAGFFRLVKGDTVGALRLMKLGTEIDPKCQDVWANMGNVHAQEGQLGPARMCFERSLRVDSKAVVALVGLVDVLRHQGGPEELQLADKYERRAQAYRLRNPYYICHLAEQARANGDWAGAERHLRRAIRLKDDEPVFHELFVEVLRQLGRTDDAKRAEVMLAKLRARLAAAAANVVR